MTDKLIAFVTGSTRGIGKSCAEILSESGYHVVVSSSREASDIEETLKEFDSQKYTYVQCDISDFGSREKAFSFIEEKFGRLDLLVNNAGVACKKRLDILETTSESVDRLININLKGTFYMCQKAANYMISKLGKVENYRPRIINISSISAYTSSVSRGEYCISKAGISMVTELFADRLAEYSIPVFEVRPGIIMTDMTECVKDKYIKMIEEDGITPIKRMGKPEDVAKCVKAAASGLLDFGTGTVLNADGGFHIRRL